MKRIFAGLIVASLLAGCASNGHRAPVVERGSGSAKMLVRQGSGDKDWRPQVHVVQRGETLYGIAFNYGLDPHELAELNNIQDPNLIQVGQQIKLFPAAVESHPPVETHVESHTLLQSKPVLSLVKEQPKVVKYAYSETAVAKAEAVQSDDSGPRATARVEVKSESRPVVKPEVPSENSANNGGDDALDWGMPTQGKLIGSFSEADNRKGIDIAGKLGQPILASAAGKVVYSGSGLRGYGKLLIIKHNKTYLSAYAHNDKLLVKEGEMVTRGQKIAEMGNSDSNQVELHFEVRRLGKPVDPANYLSLGKP